MKIKYKTKRKSPKYAGSLDILRFDSDGWFPLLNIDLLLETH